MVDEDHITECVERALGATRHLTREDRARAWDRLLMRIQGDQGDADEGRELLLFGDAR